MKLLEAIKNICEPIMTTRGYSFENDEARMLAANTAYPCIYFEEYYKGSYHSKYRFDKSADLCLWFIAEAPADADANARELLRERLEEEAVQPFISAFVSSSIFKETSEWRFFAPPPRFSENEVAIMLVFSSVLPGCL